MPQTSLPSSSLLKPSEVATQIRAHHRTVLDLIQAGAFPNVIGNGFVGRGARYLVPQADVDQYLASRKVSAA
ncbi:hypothetical protein GCM10009616_40310 [Microlunatus lacustris]